MADHFDAAVARVSRELSLRRLAEHREAVTRFNNAYAAYLEAGPQGRQELRDEVLRSIPAAEVALEEAEINISVAPPPAIPTRIVYHGLTNTVFLHEQGGFYGTVPRMVFDVVRVATARLEELERNVLRRRRSPLYWGDRIVSAILRFPAYLVAKVLGVPTARIDKSFFGAVLRVMQFLVAAFGIYKAGSSFGWW